VRDFLPLSEAGAAIVSGSQAHHPHGLAFVDDRLVHFGLGNLFSDQVRMPFNAGPRLFNPDLLPVPGTRLAFIDRHIIYDGRHISTELLTIVLEEDGQPRPMTEDERRIFLQDTFTASGW
jgi:poly-gamma-glutamate synthesis protein (capsule biosynthesis protein)